MSTTSDGFSGETPISSRFLFEVDGVEIGVFSEVSGLELNVEVATYNGVMWAWGNESAAAMQFRHRCNQYRWDGPRQ